MSSAKTPARLRLRTIGARLTLWGAFVTFAICASLCAALYAGVHFTLLDEVDTFLRGEVAEFVAAANDHGGDDETLQREFRAELAARTLADLAFRMYDLHGVLLVSSDARDIVAEHWTPDSDGSNRYTTPTFETISPAGGEPSYRLCTLRVTLNDGRTCIAQASYSLERMAAALSRFRGICGVALALSVALAAAVGRFLASRSLNPLRRITLESRSMGVGQLGQRLSPSGTGDELDQLIATQNELLDRIERHVLQLRQFTADASHELRTPLTALRGATEVAISKERTSAELRRVLIEHLGHFERLQRIAEDLLLLSRLDTGEDVCRKTALDLTEAVRASADLYRPVAEERSLELSVDAPVAVNVLGDPGRIRQVVNNLLDNAVKYTRPPGRISLSLALDGDTARITVADSGIGMSEVDLSHAFDRFYRADGARNSKRGSGSGLGLSICQSIIHAHGGHIELTSKPNVGTTAIVTLPARVRRRATP